MQKKVTEEGKREVPTNFQSQASSKTNLYVNRVPLNWNEQHLREIFGKYGQIRSVMIKKPQIWSQNIQNTGATTSSGIAYIDFLKEEDAAKAMKELQGYSAGSL